MRTKHSQRGTPHMSCNDDTEVLQHCSWTLLRSEHSGRISFTIISTVTRHLSVGERERQAYERVQRVGGHLLGDLACADGGGCVDRWREGASSGVSELERNAEVTLACDRSDDHLHHGSAASLRCVGSVDGAVGG